MVCLYPLICRSGFTVKKETRDAFTKDQLESIDSVQQVHDLLFTIAPLAVHCELVRIKPFGAVENVGSWMPQVKRFFNDYCTHNKFAFEAVIYAQVNDRLHVELFPLCDEEKVSLNELLVREKFAEFKLESDFCQHMSFRRGMNSFHEAASNTHALSEVELLFDTSTIANQEFTLNVSTQSNHLNPLIKTYFKI